MGKRCFVHRHVDKPARPVHSDEEMTDKPIHVKQHARRQEVRTFTRRDPLYVEKEWDFGEFKLHPLWDSNPVDEPELAIRPGDVLYRGTSSVYVGEGAKVHQWKGSLPPQWMAKRRIYMSEGAEDAAGYGAIAVEDAGGKPVLCEIMLDKELFKALKPGYEGSGEWFVEMDSLPKKAVRCIPLKEGKYGDVAVPWEKLRRE